MSVFVVIIEGDEKHDILNPYIVGPFASESEAESFIEQHPRFDLESGILYPGWNGGYAAAHVVSAASALNPDLVLQEWKE